MKIQPKCNVHQVDLVGWLFVIDRKGIENGNEGPWQLDLSNMTCPRFEEEISCHKTWSLGVEGL